jgi:hypothetical protein
LNTVTEIAGYAVPAYETHRNGGLMITVFTRGRMQKKNIFFIPLVITWLAERLSCKK